MLYQVLKYLLLGPLLRLVFRPRIEGLEHVPEEGAAIIASNHLSFADHFVMPAIVPRRVTFLAKAEYFTGPGLKGRLTAAFFRGVGQIPVDRSGGRASQAALSSGLAVLRKGGCSASTRRAPARTTGASTRGVPASPRWPSPRGCRWCRAR